MTQEFLIPFSQRNFFFYQNPLISKKLVYDLVIYKVKIKNKQLENLVPLTTCRAA